MLSRRSESLVKEHNSQIGQILDSKMTLFRTKSCMIDVNKLENQQKIEHGWLKRVLFSFVDLADVSEKEKTCLFTALLKREEI